MDPRDTAANSDGPRSLYVLVPMLNEAANLPRLMASMRGLAAHMPPRLTPRIVIVDDGSTDGTAVTAASLAGGLNLTVLRHDRRRGPGGAFATGFTHLARFLNSDDYVVTMEGDNTSRLELLSVMFARAREGYDVILASPYLYGGSIEQTTTWRVVLSRIANVFVKEVLGLAGLATVSSFYRLYRGGVILNLQRCYGPGIVERAGFECMVELLLKMVYTRTTISEVPMTLDTSLRAGKSKMNVLATIGGYLRLWHDTARWRAAASPAANPACREPGRGAPASSPHAGDVGKT
jgi:dolichol-phosphate mannosyltransferase